MKGGDSGEKRRGSRSGGQQSRANKRADAPTQYSGRRLRGLLLCTGIDNGCHSGPQQKKLFVLCWYGKVDLIEGHIGSV